MTKLSTMATPALSPYNPSTSTGKPLVSIVINNRNYGRFLGTAISTSLSQTYQPVEVIVVDDGSTDDSRSVIESFGDRIRAIYKENGGQGSALNDGFAESRGELIMFLDSDDFLKDTAIAEAVDLFEPGVAKVHFYLHVISGPEGEPTEAVLPAKKLSEGDVSDQIMRTGTYTSPPGSGNLYARSALAGIMPMPAQNWKVAADSYPILLAPFHGTVRSTQHPLGYYRAHGGGQGALTEMSGKLLRFRLEKEGWRDAMLANFCASKGLAYIPGSTSNSIVHLKIRFSSLALEPKLHPYPEDRMWRLVGRMLRLCWADRDFSLKKKALFLFWIISVLCSPNRYKLRAIEVAFVPTRRSNLLQRWTAGTKRASK